MGFKGTTSRFLLRRSYTLLWLSNKVVAWGNLLVLLSSAEFLPRNLWFCEASIAVNKRRTSPLIGTEYEDIATLTGWLLVKMRLTLGGGWTKLYSNYDSKSAGSFPFHIKYSSCISFQNHQKWKPRFFREIFKLKALFKIHHNENKDFSEESLSKYNNYEQYTVSKSDSRVTKTRSRIGSRAKFLAIKNLLSILNRNGCLLLHLLM